MKYILLFFHLYIKSYIFILWDNNSFFSCNYAPQFYQLYLNEILISQREKEIIKSKIIQNEGLNVFNQ
ncbi:hypothetical protein pb186bvf_021039 [Paramecium bursaria]